MENLSNSTQFSLLQYSDSTHPKYFQIAVASLLQFLVDGVGIVLITCVGIIGNLLSVFVLKHPKMRSSTSVILIGLAMVDTVYIICYCYIAGVPRILVYSEYDYTTLPIFLLRGFPATSLGYVCHTASVYLTLLVSLERYLAVCHPLKAKTFLTIGKAYIVVIGVVTFSIIIQFPQWFAYWYEITTDQYNMTHYLAVRTKLVASRAYQVYNGITYVGFEYGIPLILLLVFNSFIFITIQKSNKMRKHIKTQERQENSVSIMLLVVVLVFLLCHVAPIANIIVGFVTGNHSIPGFDSFRNFLLVFNSSINFIIYCTCGKKFRSVAIEVFGRKSKAKTKALVMRPSGSTTPSNLTISSAV